MTQIKKGDFIEVSYTGTLDDGTFFDTTDETVAKKHNSYDAKHSYKPIVVCIGEKHLLAGLDTFLVGKEIGKKYHVKLDAADAFGRKDPKLMKLIPLSVFKKQNMMPQPGTMFEIDGTPGVIRSVNGGRVIIDFNHPLSGRDVIYDITILRKEEDTAEQVKAILAIKLNLHDIEVTVTGNKATIINDKITDAIKTMIEPDIIRLTSIKNVEIKTKE